MAVSVQTAERRVEKSAQAFRTISEVATELDVPQHVLRFWESKFSQVRPLKRGGGRRYYRPEDIDLLRRIRTLLYEDGYTIKGVQRLLKEGRGRLPQQQRLDLAAESALENLRIVSARAEAMTGGDRQPLPRDRPAAFDHDAAGRHARPAQAPRDRIGAGGSRAGADAAAQHLEGEQLKPGSPIAAGGLRSKGLAGLVFEANHRSGGCRKKGRQPPDFPWFFVGWAYPDR